MDEGLVCEYGTSTVPLCDTLATCTKKAWVIRPPVPNALACGGGPPIMCPPNFGSVPRGSLCMPAGGYCDYELGRCQCAFRLGGPAHLPAVWMCQDPAVGCPKPRPRLGSVCSQDGILCDYGACYIDGGNQEDCVGGVWVERLMACPVVPMQ
jgi:hypothetical protein